MAKLTEEAQLTQGAQLTEEAKFTNGGPNYYGGTTHRGSPTYRAMQPQRPQECGGQESGEAQQESQRFLPVSGHQQEHRGGEPIVAREAPLQDAWRRGVKELQRSTAGCLELVEAG